MSSTVTLPQDREKLFQYFEQQEPAKANDARPTEPTPVNGRAANGRFAPGNGGGPGNPFGRRVGELRKAMLLAVHDDDIQEIMRALIEKAKEGHVPAAKLVLSYTIGKPTDAVDPDRRDIDEYQLEADKSVAARDLNAVLHSFPVDVAKAMLDIVWPCMLAKHGQTLNELQAESERTKREIEELDQALKADLELRKAAEAAEAAEAAARRADVSPAEPSDQAATNAPSPVEPTASDPPSPNGVFHGPAGEQTVANESEARWADGTPTPTEDVRPSANGVFGRSAENEPEAGGADGTLAPPTC